MIVCRASHWAYFLLVCPQTLFCLEFVEITNKIETAGNLKARKRKGVAVRKGKYIYSFLRPLWGHCNPPRTLDARGLLARQRPLVPRVPSTLSRARSRALEENNSFQNITVCGQTNFLQFCLRKILIRIKSFTILLQISAKWD